MQRGGEDFIPNGILSSKEPYVEKVLDKNRLSKVEARISELLAHTQANPTSEALRNDIISHLRILIMSCVPSQVFAFGSVPLKTYLPDGDIDLTVFGDKQCSEDRLMEEVLHILEGEQKNENAPFPIKQLQIIRAEVKIIKCFVENFVVDIAFNQISGLCTLYFLEEVNYLIRQSHLLKRSIILIKAWCYYESRILGSQHGLLSTYALETLVIYTFHVYNQIFAGPFEVLYRFLEFFSKFDWANYCISLRGPVPISSLPNVMRAEPPRRNCHQLLLTEKYVKACENCYSVTLSDQEFREKPFASKHINIVDPLRPSNNLGRSIINKGSFSRIKSAIALGAKRVERILSCPEDNLIDEVDLFFRNTWKRNGNGCRADAHSYDFYAGNNYFTSHDSAQASYGFQGEHTNTMNNALDNRGKHHHVDSHQSLGQNQYDWINGYAFDENAYPVNEAVLMHEEEYDVSIFNEHMNASMNINPSAVFFQPPPPHVLAPGYMHEDVTSFESFSGHSVPYSYGTGPFHAAWFPNPGPEFFEAQRAVLANYNKLVSHSDHQRQMSVKSGSRSRKHRGNSHDYRNKNKNVKNSRASSRFRTGSSSMTYQPYGVSGNRIGQSTTGTDLSENTSIEAITSQVQALLLGEKLPMTVPNSAVPGHTPVRVPSCSSQRAVDNQTLLPVSDGSSGSSFQVPTMVPFYNVPTETETTFATNYDVSTLAEQANIIYSSPSSVWNSVQHVNQTSHDAATFVLDGDIQSCYLNMLFGRLWKNSQPQRSLPPPSNTLPLRKQFPWHRKPKPSGVTRRVHAPVPVMPSQHASSLHGGTIESGAFLLPSSSAGTGTFMPNRTDYNKRYYRNKHYDKIRFKKIQKNEKKRDEVERPGSNESSDRGESSRSGNSEAANSGSDSKSSSLIIKNHWGSTKGKPGQ